MDLIALASERCIQCYCIFQIKNASDKFAKIRERTVLSRTSSGETKDDELGGKGMNIDSLFTRWLMRFARETYFKKGEIATFFSTSKRK